VHSIVNGVDMFRSKANMPRFSENVTVVHWFGTNAF